MDDSFYMKRALALAAKGEGFVSPNPLVGAVLVKDGRIIGEGWHKQFGKPHAEVNAIDNSTESPEGATLYVTLEPCSHEGKTAPCSSLIIKSGISRVVSGMQDPNPLVNGKGLELLKSHGIDVTPYCLESECLKLNEVFCKYITTHEPFVVFKYAMTMDGKIATVDNASRWITGEESRKIVHRMRNRISSVMVGVDTVIYDNPLLNVRLKGRKCRSPLKIVADTCLRIPMDAKLLANEPHLCIIAATDRADRKKVLELRRRGAEVIICPVKDNHVDLGFLFRQLGKMEIDGILLEGGSTLAFSALKDGLVDKVVAFIAPKILGGASAPTPVGGEGIAVMEKALYLKRMSIHRVKGDLMVEGYLK
jgi:diaminohydroxyphosphoribosylaminopyrimidine deaminase/5-amino-6-(5-phosphoribosylamino)uracil reductase